MSLNFLIQLHYASMVPVNVLKRLTGWCASLVTPGFTVFVLNLLSKRQKMKIFYALFAVCNLFLVILLCIMCITIIQVFCLLCMIFLMCIMPFHHVRMRIIELAPPPYLQRQLAVADDIQRSAKPSCLYVKCFGGAMFLFEPVFNCLWTDVFVQIYMSSLWRTFGVLTRWIFKVWGLLLSDVIMRISRLR